MGLRSSLGAAQFLKAARPGLRKGEEAHVPGEQPTAKKKQVGQGFIGEQAHGVQTGCRMNGDTRGRAFRPPRTERSARRGYERPLGRALAQTGSLRPRLILSSSFREGARGENSQSWHLYKFVSCIFENGCVWAQTL